MERELTRPQVSHWRTAVFAIFLVSGLAIATWASRVPDIKLALGVDNFQIGLLFLGTGGGSIIGLSLSPVLLARLGGRRAMRIMGSIMGAAMLLIGLGTDVMHSYLVVGIALTLMGFGGGSLDVMMNVEGAAIEKEVNKTILPLFHAFFSVGTVVGAGIGVAAAAMRVSVGLHMVIMGIIILVALWWSLLYVPVRHNTMDPEADEVRLPWRQRLHTAMEAWREPRTYALGVVMLGMAFAEGSANDWLALGIVDGHGGTAALGAAGLTVFSLSMTIVRVFGGPLVDRFGRVNTLRVLALLATAGMLLFILAPTLPLVFVGAALWGAGASLGFPLGMSAAADDPEKAAARVSATATIGYLSFLCGPPVLGFISEHIGLLNTLYIIVFLVVASGLFSSAARPIAGSQVGAGHHHA